MIYSKQLENSLTTSSCVAEVKVVGRNLNMRVVDIEGYPNYTISEDLIVRKKGYLPPYKYAKAVKDKPIAEGIKNGYCVVGLRNDKGQKKDVALHRIIAQAFIPNPNNLPHINHLNGCRTDNRPNNLAWCTAKENNLHAREILKFGTEVPPKKECVKRPQNFGKIVVNQFTKDGVFIKTHAGIKEAAKSEKVSSATIWSSITGKGMYKRTEGKYQYRWEYAGESTQERLERRRKEREAEKSAKPKPIIKLDLEGNFIEAYLNMAEAAKSVGGVNKLIARAINGEYKTYKGYRWEKREA